MFRRIVAVFVLAFIGSVAVVTAADAQVPFAGEFHQIRNVGSNLCLQPKDGNPNFDTPIVQEPCNGSSTQGWAALNMGNNHYRFLNPNGWCINVGGELADGVRVQQDECAAPGQDTVSDAEWNAGARLPQVVTLRSLLHGADNNFCLDVPGGRADLGSVIQVWACNGTLAQRWVVGFD
jgi:Ricin-type beta-trefoil lectin domain